MELTTLTTPRNEEQKLFMITKIQNLNGTHNSLVITLDSTMLFMITKIQNLNGTHNAGSDDACRMPVVYDYKDTKFEWNSQLQMYD